jgi:hypothetical protein
LLVNKCVNAKEEDNKPNQNQTKTHTNLSIFCTSLPADWMILENMIGRLQEGHVGRTFFVEFSTFRSLRGYGEFVDFDHKRCDTKMDDYIYLDHRLN